MKYYLILCYQYLVFIDNYLASACLVVQVTVLHVTSKYSKYLMNKRTLNKWPLRTRELRENKGVEDKEGAKHDWDTLRLFTWSMSEDWGVRTLRTYRFGHSSRPEIMAGLLALEEWPKGAITWVRDACTIHGTFWHQASVVARCRLCPSLWFISEIWTVCSTFFTLSSMTLET